MKDLFPALRENRDLRRRVGESILAGRFSHAYVIQGAAGTGKRLFARQIAAALVCEARARDGVPLPCGVCPACRKVLDGATPDLVLLDRGDAATVGVDAIRRLREDMYLSPTELDKKIYLIHEADRMTPAAQNALLVMLEEPPTDVAIFLLCENTAALLPTVRSRVQTLRMSLFDTDALARLTTEKSEVAERTRRTDRARFDSLIAAAEGSPGRALALFGGKEGASTLVAREEILEILRCINPRAGFARLHAAVAALPSKRPELLESLRLASLALRDLILVKRDESAPLCFFGTGEEALALQETFSLRCLFRASDAVSEAAVSLNQNANISVVLASLTDALWHAPAR